MKVPFTSASKNRSFLQTLKPRRVSRQVCLALPLIALLVFSGGVSFAAGSANSDLEKMELKFFHHTYPKEDDTARLDRLEKMFYGEARPGPPNQRLSSLKELVPDLDEVTKTPSQSQASSAGNSQPQSQSQTHEPAQTAQSEPDERPDEGTTYPAITPIEQRKLGKTFESEPVGTRLARLEKKVFGKASDGNDFTDRMDRLKSATGVDIAKQAPDGTDWADDEVQIDYPTPTSSLPQQTVRRAPTYGEDGKTFSGRDLREDMKKAFGSSYPSSSGSGYYGMPGGSNSSSSGGASGAYGFTGSSSSGSRGGVGLIPNDRSTAYAPPASSGSGYPPVAPPISRGTTKAMGLNQQIDIMESQIFGRNFSTDTLPARVSRLENTVFPNKNINKNAGLPDRVSRLAGVIPISNSGNMVSNANAYPRSNPNAAPAPAPAPSIQQSYSSDPNMQAQANRGRSGLSKVLGAMSNFIGGGFSVGSYPMTGASNLITDPQTGLYLDRMSGNLIDPHTGMVVGNRGTTGYNNVSPGYGYRSFNNGFSPPVTPYSYGGGSGFGIGSGYGTGVGTGFGGVGGMWP